MVKETETDKTPEWRRQQPKILFPGMRVPTDGEYIRFDLVDNLIEAVFRADHRTSSIDAAIQLIRGE